MFGDNFSDEDVVFAAQAKSVVMIFGGFPVGLCVDKLGHRALVNALTNLVAIVWWLPFLTGQSWVYPPMVGFFSCNTFVFRCMLISLHAYKILLH